MKMASFYISRKEIAEKLGIEEDQVVFGKVESNYHEIQFDVIISNEAETDKATSVPEGRAHLLRQRLYDIDN